MKDNKYIQKIRKLNDSIPDRHLFHKEAAPLLKEMVGDKSFWVEVFKQNLNDDIYKNRKWTMFEIPFFYVFENADFYLKIHIFVPLQSYEPFVAASAIHHHNNYLLTTCAAFGSGYETMLFNKQFVMDPSTRLTDLTIRERFTQKERPLHMVDAWEPHVVINPTSLSATLVLWSPDKKRKTDSLRSNPLLKILKKPLRQIIYLLGLDRKIGIAAKDTFQYYPKGDKFYAIPEDDFFAPTKAQVGPEVDNYSIQTVFAFMQRMGFNDYQFLKELKLKKSTPKYFYRWIDMMINKERIPDTFAKETINVPGGKITVEDILRAGSTGESKKV